jgi:hypothetical protein
MSGDVITQGRRQSHGSPTLASVCSLAPLDFTVFHQSVRQRLVRSLFKKAIKKEKLLGLGGSLHVPPEEGSGLPVVGLGLALIAW